jgi:hypothetical protein
VILEIASGIDPRKSVSSVFIGGRFVIFTLYRIRVNRHAHHGVHIHCLKLFKQQGGAGLQACG